MAQTVHQPSHLINLDKIIYQLMVISTAKYKEKNQEIKILNKKNILGTIPVIKRMHNMYTVYENGVVVDPYA